MDKSQKALAQFGAKVFLDDQKLLHWPVMLMYPEHQQSDYIKDFCEGQPCATNGDGGATCEDLTAPQVGRKCTCSTGYVADGEGGCEADATSDCSDNDCAAAVCASGGDQDAVCVDVEAPKCFDCHCSEGYHTGGARGACVDVPGCASRPCVALGDAAAECLDASAPLSGNTCTCSAGFGVFAMDATQNSNSCQNIDSCEGSPCGGIEASGTRSKWLWYGRHRRPVARAIVGCGMADTAGQWHAL